MGVRIGIDLGTTNTVVAFLYDDGPHVVPRGRGLIIPSAVHLCEDGRVVAGEAADDQARCVVRSVKRLMGRTFDEALRQKSDRYFKDAAHTRLTRRGANDIALELAQGRGPARSFWPHEISAEVLKRARAHAEAVLGPVEGAVVTVPAYFHDPHRRATLDAAEAAGLELLGPLLDEPSAAALAFAHLGIASSEPILVADWGGGTLDLTVTSSDDGRTWFQLAIKGDLTLGGDDVDRVLAERALEAAGQPASLMEHPENDFVLRRAARTAKEALSAAGECQFFCAKLVDPETGRKRPPVGCRLTRAVLEDAMAPLLDRARGVLEDCLSQRDVDRAGVHKVLLVGGSSRIPAFRVLLKRVLPGAALLESVDPMEAVALGAAIFVESAPDGAGRRSTVSLEKICPFGYAVVQEDGSRVDVIPPRSDVPTPEYARFAVPTVTRYAGQTVYRLNLAPYDEHARGLRTYLPVRRLFVRGMPPTAAGTTVDVELWLDENKEVQAACHVEGLPSPRRMEGWEEGPDEVFQQLRQATLDAEALCEANTREAKGLIPLLSEALVWGRAALDGGDREQSERSRGRVEALLEQVRARLRTQETASPDAEERVRSRVAGWLPYIEADILPRCWALMGEARKEEAIQALQGLRIMLQTRAPGVELASRFDQLCQDLAEGDSGPVFDAWFWAETTGVPQRTSQALKDKAREAERAFQAGDHARFGVVSEELRMLLAEARTAFRPFGETGALIGARPDLVPKKGDRSRAN